MINSKVKKIVDSLLFFILLFFLLFGTGFDYSHNRDSQQVNSNFVTTITDVDISRTKNIQQLCEDEVYLGGIPIGIKVGANGVLVTGFNDVFTKIGKLNIKNHTDLQVGDVITKIDNNSINSVNDISNVVSNSNEKVKVEYTRNGEIFNTFCDVFLDKKNNHKQLGIKVKDKILGIGTLTFVDRNKNFASLGHHILDSDTGASTILDNGNIYNSLIANTTKPTKNEAGHLNGMIIENRIIGSIAKNNSYGLYGKSNDSITNGLNKIKLGKKEDVVLGDAKIYSTIKGSKPKLYDVEIVKATNQHNPAERSMVVRIKDKELLASTGGIVQGMSGSPIIQNGKLIGALTHVFLNDSKLGYGLYIDWMLNNL